MSNKQQGFTLLELLIAMTLMGLILAILYGGLRLGMRSWEVGGQRAEQINEMRLVQDFIRRQLTQSMAVFRTDEDAERVTVFAGEPEQLTTVTPMLLFLKLGGLYVVQFDMVEEGDNGQLRMRWYPYRPNAQEEEIETQQAVLLSGVSELKWAYFGSREDGQEPSWYERWENNQRRPELVRLSLVVREEPWPDLVARLP